MKSFMLALKSPEGKTALIIMAIGIIIILVGGYFLRGKGGVYDVVCISGAIFSMVGAERFSRLIMKYWEENKED
jgi:hypothetical protein